MSKRTHSNVVTRLRKLPSEEFENLAYDLLFLSGVQNLRWRTPSADGGRDLEGYVPVMDFSGEVVQQRWYIECKRYAQSLNWHTVYEKLAVAMNHDASYLLFVTTANFSAPCRDEVQRHNKKHPVQIRVWPFYYLDQLLSVHGQVAVKYGLVKSPQALHVDFERIIFALTKLAQATHAAAEFGQPTENRVELIAALTELISARIEDVKRHGQFVSHRFKPDRDSFDWCDPYPLAALNFDSTSLRAALSTIKSVLGMEKIRCVADSKNVAITVPSTDPLRINELFALVSTFGIIDWDLEGNEVILKAR